MHKHDPLTRGMYGRVSMNRDKLSKSVGNQLDESRLFFDDQDWPVNESLIFSDDNISASEYSTKDRPGFLRLLAAIREHRLTVLVVTEVSRITRVVEVAVDFVKLAQEAGGLLVLTTEGKQFDLNTNTGRHDFYDAVVEASRESGQKSDRIKRNKRAVAIEGRYHGGRPRYGRVRAIKDQFGRVTNTGSVGVDLVEHEAEVLRETVQRIADGWPLLSIVRDLAKRGVVGVGGEPFTTSVLRKTVSSKHLIGIREYKGREYQAAYPAIVEREVWDNAMAMLRTQDRMKSNNCKGARSYLLTNFLRCGACGNDMSAHRRDDGKGPQRAYLCRPYDNAGKKVGCGKRRLADPVELYITDMVKYRYNSPGFAEALRRAYQQDGEHDDLSGLLQKVHELETKLAELEDAYLSGGSGFDLKQLARMQSAVKADLDQTAARADRLMATKGMSVAFSGDFNNVWELADLGQRRQFISLILDHATIHPRDVKAPRNKWTHEESGQSWVFDTDLIVPTWKF